MGQANRGKDKWDRLARTWEDAGPPASPSDEDILHYEAFLQQGLGAARSGKIMVLGCTPKLRDMLCQSTHLRGYTVVCVDFSHEMYLRTTSYLRCHNAREQFVLSDWLRLDESAGDFDAVIGDKVIDNVMPDDWQELFGMIHSRLRTGGCLVVRLAPQDMSLEHISVTDALDRWSDQFARQQVSLTQAASGFWEQLLGASAFYGGKRFKTQKTGRFVDEIESIRSRSFTLDAAHQAIFAEFMQVFWESHDDEWSSYQYEEIIALMEPFFTLEATSFSSDYSASNHQPIVLMTARSL